MKKLLAIILTLTLMLTLAACGGGSDTPAPSTDAPETSQQEQQPSSATEDAQQETAAPAEAAPETAAPQTAPGEVTDFDTGIAAIPAEWQKAIGTSMFGMNTGAQGDCSDSYTNKFSGVSEEDYDKLIAYFDTLTYTEKLEGVYNCDWGQLQIGHNCDASEMTISWYAF